MTIYRILKIAVATELIRPIGYASAQKPFARFNSVQIMVWLFFVPLLLSSYFFASDVSAQLIQLYELQVRAPEQIQVLGAAEDELRQQMTSWTGFAESPPYPLDLSDDLWREIRSKEQDIRTLQRADTTVFSHYHRSPVIE